MPCTYICKISTGIHDGLTFGSGKCDEYGYWEFPCDECAREWDSQGVYAALKNLRSRVIPGQEASLEEYIREAEWLNLLAWPFPKIVREGAD